MAVSKVHRAQPFAVYLHWPFCLAKCPYCDFNSHVRDGIDQDAWRRALLDELDRAAERLPGREVSSIFFGGGTPSLMPPETVGAVLERIAARWSMDPEVEITLEANPTSVEAGRFRGYAAAGVNRLSLGVQALNDKDLKRLGRNHDADEAMAALNMARQTFARCNFDLIYARAGQTLPDWQTELTEALAFDPTHLSLYQLTIERGTQFFERWKQGDLVLPEEELATDMFDLTNATCAAQGLQAYEVSNYARPGFESRHNTSYWQSDPYIGIGPGAHGRLGTGTGRLATTRLRSPEKWLARIKAQDHGVESVETLSGDVLVAEVLMMGLRLATGLSETRFRDVTGKSFAEILPTDELTDLMEGGFVTLDQNVLAVTSKGRNVLNAVTEKLLA